MGRWHSFRISLVGAAVALAFSGLLATSLHSFAQTPDPDDLGPAPVLPDPDRAQSIVLRVVFNSATDVELVSSTVSQAPPPAQIGAPPEIGISIFDISGSLVKEFNDWHPLWIEYEDEDGEPAGVQASSGEGRFVLPFVPEAGVVRISDIELSADLIEVDARQIVLDYCAGATGDPGCASVPGPGQLPGTGGTSVGGGSNSLIWVGAIAAAIVLASAGAASLLARRRWSDR